MQNQDLQIGQPSYIPPVISVTIPKTSTSTNKVSTNISPVTAIMSELAEITNPTFRNQIIDEIIKPQYLTSIKQLFISKKAWSNVNVAMIWLSKIAIGVSSILAFVSVYQADKIWSFLTGASGTIATVLSIFEVGAKSRYKTEVNEINTILNKLKIESIPENASESDEIQHTKKTMNIV